jgi:NAD(P)-dependent dehydrogenase (short-subunit alcohol dehydrogenase family)
MRLENKLAIVTAAGSGMGRAGVERFVREGARVAAIDIHAPSVEALADALGGDRVIPIAADLGTTEGARGSIDEAVARLGGADILWAHAGVPGPASVENLDVAAYKAAMDLNVTSAILASGQVAPHMRLRGGGSIIFTASVSGLVGSMMSPLYSAAKWAIVGPPRTKPS